MKALLISDNTELKTAITHVCSAQHPVITTLTALPTMLRGGGLVTAMTPDIVFLDASASQQETLSTLDRLVAQYPQAALILLTPDQSPALLMAAIRAGVREVVGVPLDPQELVAALGRVVQRRESTQQRHGKILSFISCKGGSGTTFLAANVAYALATLTHKKTLLIDLNVQFGDAALVLCDTKPITTLVDVCAQINRLDADLLESSLIQVAPGCGILAGSNDPDPAGEIRPEQIEVILQLARQHYDFVVLDLGRQIHGVTIKALDNTDFIYPVLQQSLPYLRDGRRLLDLFSALGYRREKIQLILNRHDSAANISAAEMARLLAQEIPHRIPNNFDVVSESINQGIPALKMARSSAISKSLVDFVQRLAEAPQSTSRSMIRRLFDRHPANA